ncbi:MAG: hypothetical protein QT05_C0048G0050 [archaeon GW2011_AR13]|nr:MAG: hypothetical protein QT05_C0048G0050 [archaeon GW2011_AR13]HIG94133.1 AbrB/MazE/SpoVT family DNA-binding domain-containing protein [Nanoarchaeota archaeon]HIH63938.1 AbrB/MazE/SpoVT family DNA-binding domain-containing protein [Nanoarchaeota archaeon]HIJ09720.1 AbrB/MazE/SpoVT family DNA-binding domain-containing protein [Nanoarchaeota archaeon]
MVIKVKVKKWGNSIGIILPKELVKKEDLKENDEIRINLVYDADLSNVYGSLKGKLKKSGQKLKDEARKGWN